MTDARGCTVSYVGQEAISSDQSLSIQGAIDALVGSKVNSTRVKGFNVAPVFAATSKTNGLESVELATRYIGEDAC